MKRLLVTAGSLFLTAWVLLYGQNRISYGEYWIDGEAEVSVPIVLAASDQISINEDVDISALKDGLHQITFRFRDDSARWSTPVSRYFVKARDVQYGVPKELQLCEYWIDHNYGDVTRIPIPDQPSFALEDDLDISYLKHGLHVMSVRLKDSGGRWSPVLSRFFVYLKEDATINSELKQLEFWIDRDITSKTIVPVQNGTQILYLDDLDISGLKYGLHTISFRVQNISGSHSSPNTRFFLRSEAPKDYTDNQLSSIEYWFDGKAGESTRIDIQNNDEVTFINDLNVSDLNNGLHRISYRLLDVYGNESPAVSRFFVHFQDENEIQAESISAYRYWIDGSDPVTVSASAGGMSMTLLEDLDLKLFPKGEYKLNIQLCDNLGRWSGTVYDTIIKNAYPYAEISGDTLELCQYDSIFFKAMMVDTDSLNWSFGNEESSADSMPKYGYANAGNYQVSLLVMDTASKQSISYLQEGEIQVFGLPQISMDDTVEICSGNEALLEGPEGMSGYLWSTLSLEKDITVSDAGKYSLLVSDIHGCQNSDTLELLVYQSPVLQMPDSISILDTASYLLVADEGYVSYYWNGIEGNREMEILGEDLGLGSHVFYLEVSDEHNCSDSDTIVIVVDKTDGLTYDDYITLKLYPNPAQDYLTLSIDSEKVDGIELSIIDGTGKTLHKQKLHSVSETISIEHLSPGAYYLHLRIANESRVLRFIKY